MFVVTCLLFSLPSDLAVVIRYLSEQRLPKRMMQLRGSADGDVNDSRSGDYEDCADSDGESLNLDEISKKIDDLKSCRLEDGELQIVSLGMS